MLTSEYNVFLGKLASHDYTLQLLKNEFQQFFLEKFVVFMIINILFSNNAT